MDPKKTNIQTTQHKRGNIKTLLLLSLFSILLSLTITEMGVRFIFPDLKDAAPCHEYHPVRYWALKPNAQIKEYFRALDGKIDRVISINISSQSLRDHEYREKESNEFRILILGDSFIFGKGVNVEDTIPKQLEKLFQSKRMPKNVSVINLSTEGYGPFQERDLLNETGFALKPDLVILSIFIGNDIEETMREHGLKRHNFHTGFENRHFLLRNRDKWNYAFEYFLRRHWLTLAAFTRYIGVPQEGAIGALLEGKSFPSENHPLYGLENHGNLPYMEPDLKEWYPELETGLQLMMEDVKGIQQDCLQNNSAFMAFTIPAQEVVNDTIWHNVIESSANAGMYERGKSIRLLRDVISKLNIPYIPVAEALIASNEPTPLYISTHGHLNSNGCAFVAKILYRNLIRLYPEYFSASEDNTE